MNMTRFLIAFGVSILLQPFRAHAQDEPSSKEELEQLKGALEGLSESAAEYRGYVDALRKIKITGYVQSQFRLTDLDNVSFPRGNFSGGSFPTTAKNLFQVRRGRIKVNYDNGLSQFVIQIDAIQTGFTTKDAYFSIVEPWENAFGLQAGIFDRPFGYEISYSSSNRETPERSRLFQTLFPGERELGAKLFYTPQLGSLSFLRADLGLFNGSGPTSNEYDNYKDLIGHLAAQFPFQDANAELDLGVSGYFGKVRSANSVVYTPGNLPSGQKGFVASSDTANVGLGLTRRYLGIDAQFYYDVPSVGGAILRGEYIFGKQPGTRSTTTSFSAQPTDPLYKRDFSGWYLYYVQNIGQTDQFVVKYDVYDPNTSVSASDFIDANTSGGAGLSSSDIKYSTLGLGVIHHWDDKVKFVIYYELIRNEELTSLTNSSFLFPYARDVRDNVLTVRAQFKF
jgi:hypothetical protein